MQRHLFVYGTLMTSAGAARTGKAMRARLQREAESLGPATTAGQLYDLGRYPGLVALPQAADLVHGEVFRLIDPAGAFRWLDAYEDVTPGDPDSEYERVLRAARLASGDDLEAWVYLYRGDLTGGRRVADGRWQPT